MLGWPRRVAGPGLARTLQVLMLWVCFGLLVWTVHALWDASDAGAQAPQRGESRDDPARRGEALWRRDCVSCHGPDGDGTQWGPSLQDKGAAGVHLAITTGRMPIEDLSALQHTAPDEREVQVPSGAHGSGQYLPGQVSALVAHARQVLSGPDVPVVDVAGADVSRGAELYQLNCASCHAWSARGGALANGHAATSLERSSPEHVVEAMRTGLGTMPTFPESVIDDEEAADVAAYVAYLQHPRTGGHPLAFLGPTAEGLAAGVVGVLGLLFFVRWIGKRS